MLIIIKLFKYQKKFNEIIYVYYISSFIICYQNKWVPKLPAKNGQFRMFEPNSRQSLVKGERLKRNELSSAIAKCSENSTLLKQIYRLAEDQFGNTSQVNKQSIRAIRNKLVDRNSQLEQLIDDILPKKSQILQSKVKTEVNTFFLVLDFQVLFFEVDKVNYPTLKLLHKYPQLLPKMQVDKGGIKFIFKGANVMCPGLTSQGGYMDEVEEGSPVAIYGEGKQHAMAIGITLMSTEEIKKQNKGIAIQVFHHFNDGLWNLKEFRK